MMGYCLSFVAWWVNAVCHVVIDSILKPPNQSNTFYEYYYYLDAVRSIHAMCSSIIV